MKSSKKNILIWIIRSLIGLGFLVAGAGKWSDNQAINDMFMNWGYPDGFHLVIGSIELCGSILIMVPKTSRYASLGLILLMMGALATHLIHDPLKELLRPMLFLDLLSGNLILMRKQKDKI